MKIAHILVGAALMLTAIVCGVTQQSATAQSLPVPTGPIILTIDGAIAESNTADGKAVFDLAMLEALPAAEFATATPWTEGEQHFVGVPVAGLLARLGTTGSQAHAVATNQYEITFPISDIADHGAIIAYRQNGQLLPSDKGPLWIVFPYDSDPVLQGDRFQNASVWNLSILTIK